MKIVKIVKIHPKSAALTFAGFSAILGCVNWLIFLVRAVFAINTVSGPETKGYPSTFIGASLSGLLTFVVVVALAFIVGYVFAQIYNVIAKVFGGISIDIK